MLTLLFIVLALTGVLLIAVPRLRRRRGRGRAKPAAWRSGAARRTAAVAAPAAARTWSGGADELDDWDDDLGWVDDAPRAGAADPEPEPGTGFAWPERTAAQDREAGAHAEAAPGEPPAPRRRAPPRPRRAPTRRRPP